MSKIIDTIKEVISSNTIISLRDDRQLRPIYIGSCSNLINSGVNGLDRFGSVDFYTHPSGIVDIVIK